MNRFLAERRLIIETCLELQAMEYFMGTWGNISLRTGDRILLTPSRVVYDAMQPEDIVVIDLEGNKLEGERNPTSEKEVHRQIYRARPEVGAVIHAHTSFAMAASAMAIQEVPCLVEEMSQFLGGAIPLSQDYVPAEHHAQLGMAAAAAIGAKSGVLLRNHGSVGCGKDMAEAKLAVRVIEKACGIYLSACASGIKQREIPQKYVDSERYRFVHTYGKEQT